MISLLALSATIASGSHFTCAIGSGGAVFCFGANESGQLGDGSRESRGKPVRVVGLTGAKDIAAGDTHACVVDAEGHVLCWGNNGPGSCGVPLDIHVTTPQRVEGLPNASRVFAGHSTSCAVSTDGRLFCWGRNLSNQLGVPRGPDEAGRPSPVEIKELKDVQSVAIGDSHTCALTKRGEVYCFGSNEHGRSGGQGSVVPPTRINIGPAVAIAATSNASFATLKDGTLYFWGSWQRDRDFVMAPVPTPTGDRNVTLLFTNRHSAYVRSGSNDWRFPKAGVAAPMPPTGLSWAVEVSAGETHACGRDRDGALRCFGTNREGIGTGVPWNGKEPVVVPLDAPESDPLGTTAQPPPPPAACEASAASPSWQQAKPTPPTCGNGKRDVIGMAGGQCPPCIPDRECHCAPRVELREACDGKDLGGASCSSLGYGSGKLACTAQCTVDTSGCVPASRLPSGARLAFVQLPIDKTPTAGMAIAPNDNVLGAVWGATGQCGQAVFGQFSAGLKLLSTSAPFGRPHASRMQLVATPSGWLAAVGDRLNTWVHLIDASGQPGPEQVAFRGRPVFLQSQGPNGPYLLGLSTRNHPYMGGLDTVLLSGSGEVLAKSTVFGHQSSASETMDSYPPPADQVAITTLDDGFAVARAQLVPGVMDLGGIVVARLAKDGQVQAKSLIAMGGTSPFFGSHKLLGWLSNLSGPGETQRYGVQTVNIDANGAAQGEPQLVTKLDPSEWIITGALAGPSPVLLVPQVDAFQSTFQSNTARRIDLLTLPKQRLTVIDGGGMGAAKLLRWNDAMVAGFVWQRDGRARIGLMTAPAAK